MTLSIQWERKPLELKKGESPSSLIPSFGHPDGVEVPFLGMLKTSKETGTANLPLKRAYKRRDLPYDGRYGT